MKKATLLTIISFSSASLFSQEAAKPDNNNSFEIQAKGGYNSTWLFNKNISDAGEDQNYDKAWGYNYGAAFNAYFGTAGIGIEALMGNHTGGYTGTIVTKDSAGTVISKIDYKSTVTINMIQIPVLFKLRSEFGGYLEIGPQYNIVSSATYKATGGGMKSDTSVTTKYSSSYFSAVLGFGFKIKFGDGPLSLDAGLRLNYGLTDLKGVDALGRELSNAFYYKKPEITNSASGGVVVALTYQLNHKKK